MLETNIPSGLQVESVGTVLRASGEIDISTASTFAQAIERDPADVLCIDMRDVSFMDSSGAHVLLRSVEARTGMGCVILHEPQPAVARVLDLLGLARISNLHVLSGDQRLSAPPR